MSKNKTTSSGKAQEPSRLLESFYTPDILTCLANLSNDEVFTPPEVANAMLDLLPGELFSSPDVTFLDPACKSGIFLREAAKRLLKGLEKEIPDLQQRLDHIFKKQLFGIALTRLTSLLSRRTVYCSKFPNEKYSLCQFDTEQGNIQYKRLPHKWKDGQCEYCGAPQSEYKRGRDLESYAYNFIHVKDIKKIQKEFPMKFDVIIGNPPYQLSTGGAGKQAKPLYNLFVEQAKKLNPRYLTMIIPSRWFSGGMGLDEFRNNMIKDEHISHIVDYTNAKECFPQNSISGGVCYFLWDREASGNCQFTNIMNGKETTLSRKLNEFPVLVRYNDAVSIIHKIRTQKENTLDSITSPLMPYGLSTDYRGTAQPTTRNDLILHASNGITYIKPSEVTKGLDSINSYKILISKTSAEHAGEPGRDGKFKVLTSSLKVIGPKEVCTHSYFIIGNTTNKDEAENIRKYLTTKFVRFLILISLSSINLSKLVFSFVPLQDFSKAWTDEELYKKYDLTDEEIGFIESTIKPMDAEG